MPDITMCADGEKCKDREKCYRWLAKADRWQSYSDFLRAKLKGKKCKYLWPIETMRRKNAK